MASTALNAYVSSTHAVAQSAANDVARTLSASIEAKVASGQFFESSATNYARELGGVLPKNPCAPDALGYDVKATSEAVVVTAQQGTDCGTWSPDVFRIAIRKHRPTDGPGKL